MEVATEIGIYAGAAAFFGLALVLPLYFSQARDVRLLRTWMALTPELRRAEIEAAEAAELAEAEAPAAVAEPAPPVPPTEEPRAVPGLGPSAPTPPPPPARVATPPRGTTPAPGTTPVRALSPAERIALDRPATARITAERTAVEPPPRGLRGIARRASGLNLATVVAGVLVLGIAVVLASLQLSEDDGGREVRTRTSAVVPSEVEVAVLNGTAVPGLADKVGDDVEANGYVVGTVTNSESPFDNTVVMFMPGNEREAQAVANDLGAVSVQPMDASTRATVGEAGVAVIAGEDRAGP